MDVAPATGESVLRNKKKSKESPADEGLSPPANPGSLGGAGFPGDGSTFSLQLRQHLTRGFSLVHDAVELSATNGSDEEWVALLGEVSSWREEIQSIRLVGVDLRALRDVVKRLESACQISGLAGQGGGAEAEDERPAASRHEREWEFVRAMEEALDEWLRKLRGALDQQRGHVS